MYIAGKESDAKGDKGKSETASKSSNRSASSDKKDSKDAKKSSSSRRVSPKRADGKPSKPLKSLDEVRRERRERQIRERRERERRDRLRRERERVARERAIERERERMRMQRERERRRLQAMLREKEERERQERLRAERDRQRQRELERQRERERQERERERLRLLQEKRLREDRERLERERERLERERLQRIERERLERQKAEDRRGQKRPAEAYSRDRSPTRGPGYWQDSKRPAPDRSGDSREYLSGGPHGRERGNRESAEARAAARERRAAGQVVPKREEPREEHRRSERSSAGRPTRESPRERDSRDRRGAWENSGSMDSGGDPQKGLNLLLQRAGVSGILGGSSYPARSSGAPPAASGAASRERPGDNWNTRTSAAHSRPMVSSEAMGQGSSSHPSGRGRPPVVNESGRGWPSSAAAEKDRDRGRERDRGVGSRDVSRYSMSGSANPSQMLSSAHSLGHERSRAVVPASRSAMPPRMVSEHSVGGQPMGASASMLDSRRPVPLSGRSDSFRAGVPGIPRTVPAGRGAVRRY